MSGKVLEWSFHDEPRASSYSFEPAVDGVTVKENKGYGQLWEFKAKFEMRLDPSTLIMDVLPGLLRGARGAAEGLCALAGFLTSEAAALHRPQLEVADATGRG